MLFQLPPQGKKTPRPMITGPKNGRVADAKLKGRKDPATEAYEAQITGATIARWPDGEAPRAGLIGIDLLLVLPRPKKAKAALAYAPAKPDWDNAVKSVQDGVFKAMREILVDDCRVVFGRVAKVYAALGCEPRVVVRFFDNLPALDAPPPWLERLLAFEIDNSDDWVTY